jgi:hypothetical protein
MFLFLFFIALFFFVLLVAFILLLLVDYWRFRIHWGVLWTGVGGV